RRPCASAPYRVGGPARRRVQWDRMSKSRRFAFALVGMLQMLRAEARKGWGRASIVALVFPLAMLYVVGTLVVSAVRQALPSSLAPPSRQAGCGVDPRLRPRYRG